MRAAALAFFALCHLACSPRNASTADRGPDGRLRLVLVHQPFWGDPTAFEGLLEKFRRAFPEVALETQLLPNDSDAAHQYFLTALEGGSRDFDVLAVDLIWVPEFARAGWLMDLSEEFSPGSLRHDFLPGTAAAVTWENRSWAVPWYVDVGLLYFRIDLVPQAPKTFAELESAVAAARRKDASLQGYVWQARQYEGLVCNVYEAIWGFGGTSLSDHRLALETSSAASALSWLRHLVASGISPPAVTSSSEEEARRIFQAGRAVFMRNWPYAWAEAQKQGSPIRGKVGVAALPTQSGEPGWGALGGWQLAINARASPERRQAAVRLVRHLTSPEANLLLALSYSRNPARRATYEEPELREHSPFIAQLLPLVERARPRPITPYYGMLTDALQGEFSAAISGIRSPDAALARAQSQADRVMGVEP